MKEICPREACTGCHVCANACPQQCIAMEPDAEGFWYPVIDALRCTDCGLCRKCCPTLRAPERRDAPPEAYACIYTDDAVRAESSSGGFFTLLARQVLKHGGVVFGAAFDEVFGVAHHWAETAEAARAFRGSKYVQSRLGGAYREAERFLRADRQVLFTGTPCQIGGLRAYLAKPYDNLLAVDIICHGVPSPLVWQRYLAERAQGSRVLHVNFRDKRSGWRRFSLAMAFEDGASYCSTFRNDPYVQGFLRDLYSRPSCHRCAYRTAERCSDFTIADFWGVNKTLPQLDDNQGTSLVLVQSDVGRETFAMLLPFLKVQRADLADALRYNQAATASVTPHPQRQVFFDALPVADSVAGLIDACLESQEN